jgi:CheY-like chemotaxis protein
MKLKQLRVLLVEDDENLIEMIELAFQGEGIQMQVAHDGREGIEKALSWRPDLILMDVVMPEMNGYEATQKIRNTPQIKNTPLFFLTAKGLEPDIRDGKNAGADCYLVKPFSPFELIEVIQSFFARRPQISS